MNQEVKAYQGEDVVGWARYVNLAFIFFYFAELVARCAFLGIADQFSSWLQSVRPNGLWLAVLVSTLTHICVRSFLFFELIGFWGFAFPAIKKQHENRRQPVQFTFISACAARGRC
jgi:hypothetical protein